MLVLAAVDFHKEMETSDVGLFWGVKLNKAVLANLHKVILDSDCLHSDMND